MKAKIVLDECVVYHWPNYLCKMKDYVLSVNVVGQGAKDEEVLELAKKQKRPLVTGDIRLALYCILDNHPVIFLKHNGKAYFVKPSLQDIEFFGKIDPLTKHMLEKDEVIIP